jgi:hypothetical protein
MKGIITQGNENSVKRTSSFSVTDKQNSLTSPALVRDGLEFLESHDLRQNFEYFTFVMSQVITALF